jgi:hypothetical protein
MTEYRTSSGVGYSFSGWNAGESPLECWGKQDWLKCLHGCMLCLSLIREPVAAFRTIEDDGLLHELVHLAQGEAICLHSSMDSLRAQVDMLQRIMEAKIQFERLKENWKINGLVIGVSE